MQRVQHPILETCFHIYKDVIGKDFDKYRNHVYRVFLTCTMLDPDPDHEEMYAYAAFFHDIGIWTADTLDYLNPSISEACEYLSANGKEDLVADITLMIHWHHKITAYRDYKHSTVEVFRKADWIDVTVGLVNFGSERKQLRKLREQFPGLGFHRFLFGKIIWNFLRHPLNPLPMFKK